MDLAVILRSKLHSRSPQPPRQGRAAFKSALLFALPITLLIGACQSAKSDEEVETPARPVRVFHAVTGDIVENVDVVGELEGFEEVRVFPQVAGERLQTLAVAEGDVVKAGQVLATVSLDLLDSAEAQAKAALDAARANLRNLEDSLRRSRPLAEAGSLPIAQIESLESQVAGAEAQIRQLEAGARQAGVQRGRGQIRSPISGVVMGLDLREGDLVSAQAPLATVVRADQLKAVFRVPEREFLNIKRGMPVKVSPLARPEVVVQGEVSVVGPAVDRMTRTGLVEVHLDNSDGKLVAGSSVRAAIELSRRSDVLLVPAESLLFTAETHQSQVATAYVEIDSVAERREVKIGARQGDRIEVRSGLAAGESVVVQGAHFLRDGYPLRVLGTIAGDPSTSLSAPSAREEIAQ